jgi:hypothetical protein
MTQDRDDYMRRQEMDHDLLRMRDQINNHYIPTMRSHEAPLRQRAGIILDTKFGMGRDIANSAIRNDPVTKAIYDCAIEAIVDLLRSEENQT